MNNAGEKVDTRPSGRRAELVKIFEDESTVEAG